MIKQSLFANLKVRTSLILVLVFFLLMLIAGAALGILSLRENQKSFDRVVSAQQADAQLQGAVDMYKNAHVMLGRAVASYIVNSDQQNYLVAQQFGGATDAVLSQDTLDSIAAAGRFFDESRGRFKAYQAAVGALADPDGRYRSVTQRYETLMDKGVAPLIESARNGKIAELHARLTSTVSQLESDFYVALENLQAYQLARIDTLGKEQDAAFTLVVRMVAAAMVVCITHCHGQLWVSQSRGAAAAAPRGRALRPYCRWRPDRPYHAAWPQRNRCVVREPAPYARRPDAHGKHGSRWCGRDHAGSREIFMGNTD